MNNMGRTINRANWTLNTNWSSSPTPTLKNLDSPEHGGTALRIGTGCMKTTPTGTVHLHAETHVPLYLPAILPEKYRNKAEEYQSMI